MIKFISSITNLVNIFTNKKNNQLKLKSIKIKNNSMYCEFNEILRLDGKLIKIDINDIASNLSIKESIPTEHLFIIGLAYGQHINSKQYYKLKKIDLANKSVLIESASEKISISIEDLLHDEELIKQIDQVDILKILCPYIYKLGYDTNSLISQNDNIVDIEDTLEVDKNTNVINLF